MIKKWFVVGMVLAAAFWGVAGTAYGAAKEEAASRDWNIAFLGTLPVLGGLEIVDYKDVVAAMMKVIDKEEKLKQIQQEKQDVSGTAVSPEELLAALEKYNLGVYQFALKNNGSYNTAVVLVAEIPEEFKPAGLSLFDELLRQDKKKQEAIYGQIVKGMDELYRAAPEAKDVFQIEFLEFYPFEKLTNKNAQIVSVGGSVALRIFKLVMPAAVKVYLIRNNTDMYVFGVVNSGPDRKLWDNMSNDMLSKARWKW